LRGLSAASWGLTMDHNNPLCARLLLAAGRDYITAQGLSHAEPPPTPAQCANFLTMQEHPPEVLDGVTVQIALSDLLAAVKIIRKDQWNREQMERDKAFIDDLVSAFMRARDIMLEPGIPWKSRAMKALQSLSLHGQRKDPWKEGESVRRWEELTEGLYDYSTGIQHPLLSKPAALERLASEQYAHCTNPWEAARKALARAGVRGLPR